MTPPNPSADRDALLTLDRHATRRRQGVPTVSVLAGPPGAGGRLWRRWAAGRAGPVVTASSAAPAALGRSWLAALVGTRDLLTDALTALAVRTGRDPSAWRAMTPHDIATFWQTVPPGDSPALGAVCERLTRAAALNPGEPPDAVATLLGPDPGAAAVFGALAGVVELCPAEALPAPLLTAPPGVDQAAWLVGEAPGLALWASRLPRVPVAAVVPPDAWARYRATAPDGRAMALLGEGEVVVPILGAAETTQRLAAVGITPEQVPSGVRNLLTGGATAELVDSLTDALRTTAPAPPDEGGGARSAAERFLSEFLDALPETAGAFELNGVLDFRFGNRPAEVDLLARRERVAVEIDGYYHFQSPGAYRRDRAKDWELQRRGFLVLRFLADDIIADLEAVRDRILAALAARRAPAAPEESVP